MIGSNTCMSRSGGIDHGRRDARYSLPRRMIVGLALGAGLVLGACSIPFGSGTESTEQSSPETPRSRNRLYLQEQERAERMQQFDRGGPPQDR